MDHDFSFEWEERTEKVDFHKHFIAGSLAGLSEHLIFLPIDNIKTHLQSTTSGLKESFNLIKKHGY
jgi:hypothetical protein